MHRTGGWPAGIQAVAVTVDPDEVEAGIRRFCLADRVPADYLINDVLQAMTEGERDFLIKSSLTEMVNSELAEQLTGRIESRHILEKLFNNNVFTVTRGHGWYSYQPMFRELLTHHAAQNLPVPDRFARRHRLGAASKTASAFRQAPPAQPRSVHRS
jgi:LuxR family maltose regulon positive regulatory protein